MANKVYYRKTAARVVAVSVARNRRRPQNKTTNTATEARGSEERLLPESRTQCHLEGWNVEAGQKEEIFDCPAITDKLDDTQDIPANLSVDTGSMSLFFRLPRELRDAVYEEAFAILDLPDTILLRRHESNIVRGSYHEFAQEDPDPMVDTYEAARREFPDVVPAFCYTNRQIYQESLPIFVRRTKFSLGTLMAVQIFAHFLNRVPFRQAFRAVREMTLDLQGRWACPYSEAGDPAMPFLNIEYWAPADLIRECVGLRRLTLRVQYVRMIDYINVGGEVRVVIRKNVQSLLPSSVFTLEQLKSVTIVCLGGHLCEGKNDELQSPVTKEQVFAPLTSWMQKEVVEKKPAWQLNIRYEIGQNILEEMKDYMGWIPSAACGA